jgi:hypothetical protein
MNNRKTIPEIDHKIISYFICTHPLDSRKVDLDPYLREKDLIFFPVKRAIEIKNIDGAGSHRYTERMRSLFSMYREKN